MIISRLAILGVGLIGGSLALALKEKGLVGEVVGYGRSQANIREALALGIIDRAAASAADAVMNADMVVLAVPIASMRALLTEIRPHLAEQVVLTDVGSAKQCWVDDVLAVWDGIWPSFAVPAHPIAGAERSGASAALASLYHDRKVVITPHQHSSDKAVLAVSRMWQATGADVRQMSVSDHDQTFAWTSHLPHVLSFALVDMFSHRSDVERLFDYTAGGFRDFTRIAASDPTMWRDILQLNAVAIAQALAAYQTQLAEYQQWMQEERWDDFANSFLRAKQTRDAFLPPEVM